MAAPTILTRIKFEGLDDIRVAFKSMQDSWTKTTKGMAKTGKEVGTTIEKSVKGATAAFRAMGTAGAAAFRLMSASANRFLGVLRSTTSMLVGMGRTAASVAAKLSAVGIGAAAAVNAFGVQTGKALDDMGRMARTAGVPIEKFSRLASQTRLLGGDVANLSEGLKTLSEKIVEAAVDTNSSGGKAFASLGLSVRKSNGELKTTEEMLDEVADALAKVESDTLRAAAANELFSDDARYLLPMLEDGAAGLRKFGKEADRFGTVVTEAQSRSAKAMLVEYRKVGESLRGIGYRVAEGILPTLTSTSTRITDFLVGNTDKITKVTKSVLGSVAGVTEDLAKVVLDGGRGVEREWIRKVVPAAETARDVFLDLVDVMGGTGASRVKWLREVSSMLQSAAGAAGALATAFSRAAGLGDTKLPSMTDAVVAARLAFESLRLGIEGQGDEASMPWAAGVGEILGGIATASGSLARIVAENKESILAFLAAIPPLVADGIAAIKSLWAGEQIAPDNAFAFLNDWKKKWDEWVVWAQMKWDEYSTAAVAAYAILEPILSGLWGLFDELAKAIGMGGALEAVFVFLIAKATGLTKALGLILSAGKKIGGWMLSIGKSRAFSILSKAALAFVGTLSLPALAIAAMVAAFAAAVVAIVYYWDELTHAAGVAMDWIIEKWGVFADWITGLFSAAWDGIKGFWEDLKAAPGKAWSALVDRWQRLKDWIGGVFDAASDRVSSAWDAIASMPGRAWQSLVDTWSGFTSFFSGLVDKVAGFFRGLWDGVKSGASDAWSTVKGWFGFGDERPAEGSADRSPKLATGGIVRGPGGPVGDRIRAWLSNGEGVLNARAVAHYGEGLVHALNGLLVPKTHFASGGIVGQMVPATSGAGLGALHLSIDGRRNGGSLFGDADAMRTITRDFRRSGTVSRGPQPRWKGAYR